MNSEVGALKVLHLRNTMISTIAIKHKIIMSTMSAVFCYEVAIIILKLDSLAIF